MLPPPVTCRGEANSRQISQTLHRPVSPFTQDRLPDSTQGADHLGERIAAPLVVTQPGLVLASPAPSGPGADAPGIG
jgi:hypothetical protein